MLTVSELQARLKGKRTDLPAVKNYPVFNPYKFKRTIVIDCANLSWKSYHAKMWSTFKTSKGLQSGHVYGAFTKIFAMVRDYCIKPKIPTSLVLVWDEFKVKQVALYSGYKANRGPREFTPVPDVQQMLSCFPHTLVSIPTQDEETDSIIASYVSQTNFEHLVLSSDRDMWQLWNKARIFESASKEFNSKDYKNTFGTIPPRMIPLYKAIFGDSSDNIPHVINSESEIGRATRETIIMVLSEIDKPQEVFKHSLLSSLNDKHRMLIKENREQIKTMYKVAKLHRKAKIQITQNTGDYKTLEDLMVNKWECKSKIKDIKFLRGL